MLRFYKSTFLSFDKNLHISTQLKVVQESCSVLNITHKGKLLLSAEKESTEMPSIEFCCHWSKSEYYKFPDAIDVVMLFFNAILNYDFSSLATQKNVYKIKNLEKSVTV